MSGRKILMVINFFPPAAGGGVYRPLSFVKYLSRLSWRVTVVTPRPGEFWISDPLLEREVPAEVRVVRTPSLSGFRLISALQRGSGRGSGARRSSSGFGLLRRAGEWLLVPDTYVGWVPFAASAASRLCREERFDAVYSTSPPDSSHLVALWIARRFRTPWVADFRDPWINLYLREPPTPLHRRLHERLERAAAGADLVLVTTDIQREMLLARYPRARIEKIPNGYDEEDYEGLGDIAPPEKPFTLTHCGMLTLGRSVRPFLAGLALLRDRSPVTAAGIRAVFIGARESENEEWVKRFGLEGNAVFEENLPHRECVRRERASHALLLIKHHDPRYMGLVPGKLYEYLGAARPILAVVPEGEAAGIVRSLRRGEVASIDSPSEIAERLERMYTLYREGALDRAYDTAPVSALSRRAEAARLDELLRSLVEES